MRGAKPCLWAKGLATAAVVLAGLTLGPAAQAVQGEGGDQAAATLPYYSGSTTMTLRLQPVPADQQREVPYDRDGQLVFQARLGDRDTWAFLDSGAQTSVLDATLARESGLQVFALLRGAARGLGGAQAPLRLVKDASILIPGQAQAQFSVLPALDQIITGPRTRPIGFVLGRDVLSRTVVMIDPVRHTFRLGASGSIRPPPGASVLKVTPAAVVETTINGKQMKLQIDTGFNTDMALTRKAWRKLDLSPTGDFHGMGLDGVVRTFRLSQIPEITLGSAVVRDVGITELSTPTDEWDGQIGLGILLRFQTTLDLAAHKLWLAPIAGGGAN